jgi:uncharacterized protein (DUF1015 family)
MATIKPFKALRPAKDLAQQIAALPYDVYNRQEAKDLVSNNPLSFLQIDRGETLLDDQIGLYDEQVYAMAKTRFNQMIDEKQFIQDERESLYIYELERLGKIQRGIVGCVLAKEYISGTIKKHENTREAKEHDRIRHIDTLKAHTGPIFLTYKNTQDMQEAFEDVLARAKVIFEFIGDDEVRHKGYVIEHMTDIEKIQDKVQKMNSLYIADGHHRAASAAKIAEKYHFEGESAQFLAVAFPDSELEILDYNRVVKDLNNLSKEEFFERLETNFTILSKSKEPFAPKDKGTFGMYFDHTWYGLVFNGVERLGDDPVRRLDVAILQEFLLEPILGIEDPRTSERIDFVGGIRGLAELEKRVHDDMAIAFAMKPTSIQELIDVSDANRLMPPKSTWFEPKLRSGLFIHQIV